MYLVGSLICALSPTSVALIIGRAIAGAGGAVFPPSIFSDSRESFQVPSQLSRTSFLFDRDHCSLPLLVESMLLPLLPGLLQEAHLPSTSPGDGGITSRVFTITNSFYINLPIGAITIATIALLLPVPHQPLASLPLRQKFDEVDFLGAFFLLPYYPLVTFLILVLLCVFYWLCNGVAQSMHGTALESLGSSLVSDL